MQCSITLASSDKGLLRDLLVSLFLRLFLGRVLFARTINNYLNRPLSNWLRSLLRYQARLFIELRLALQDGRGFQKVALCFNSDHFGPGSLFMELNFITDIAYLIPLLNY